MTAVSYPLARPVRRSAARPRPALWAGHGGHAVYHRRRVMAAVAAALLLWLAAVCVAGAVRSLPGLLEGHGPSATRLDRAQVHVVRPGETFWSITRDVAPSRDPRPIVDRLVAEHGSPVLYAGEELLLPSAL